MQVQLTMTVEQAAAVERAVKSIAQRFRTMAALTHTTQPEQDEYVHEAELLEATLTEGVAV